MENIKNEGKFNTPEITALRNELFQNAADYNQATELIKIFLTGRGYSITNDAALKIAEKANHIPLEALKQELEQAALEN